MAKGPGGRPTVMTEEVIRLLEEAFKWGCTDLEACCNADISKTALYEYCIATPEFAERKETLKNSTLLKAKMVISKSLDDDDVNSAHKVVDRKEGTKVKQDITSGGAPINTWTVMPVTTDKNG